MTNVRYALRLVARKPIILVLTLVVPLIQFLAWQFFLPELRIVQSDPLNGLWILLAIGLLDLIILQPAGLELLYGSALEMETIKGWFPRGLCRHWYKPLIMMSLQLFLQSCLLLVYWLLLQVESPLVMLQVLFFIFALVLLLIAAYCRLTLSAMTEKGLLDALRTVSSRGLWVAKVTIAVVCYASALLFLTWMSQSTEDLLDWPTVAVLPVCWLARTFLLAYSFALVYSEE